MIVKKFTSQRIPNQEVAKSIYRQPINNPNIQYPYNIFKSNLTNQCLTINDEGVYLEPCNGNIPKQHWKISPGSNNCPI